MDALTGRTAVVTGAASGIGRAMVERFAAKGMRVVLADIEPDALAAATDELVAGGAEASGVRTDVTDIASVQALSDAARERFGPIHVLCNNAGTIAFGPTWELDLAEWLGDARPAIFDGFSVLTAEQRRLLRAEGCRVASIGRGEGDL